MLIPRTFISPIKDSNNENMSNSSNFIGTVLILLAVVTDIGAKGKIALSIVWIFGHLHQILLAIHLFLFSCRFGDVVWLLFLKRISIHE